MTRGIGLWRPWKGEVRARTRAAREFPAHLAITPILDRRGRVLGTVGVLRDLTEQHEMQRRLIHQETLASLGQMAAGVAHEIRNPLGGIKMAVSLLAGLGDRSARSTGSSGSDGLAREMVETARSAVLEIEAIVSSLLDYARDTELDRQPYDLERILAEVVQALGAEAASRGVRLSCEALPGLVVALLDGQKIRQVVTNVVRNGIEAAERRPGARVDVRCVRHDGAITVDVTDNGAGMTAEERRQMFRPFFTTKPAGTGLGLAIVKKIVDLHGGEIHVESEPGRGTRVRIVLPAGVTHEATGADRRG
jgi:two-component system sensor histidine kinase HydH